MTEEEQRKKTLAEFLDSAMKGKDLTDENAKKKAKAYLESGGSKYQMSIPDPEDRERISLENAGRDRTLTEFWDSAMKGKDIANENAKAKAKAYLESGGSKYQMSVPDPQDRERLSLTNKQRKEREAADRKVMMDNAVPMGPPLNGGWEDVPDDGGWEDVEEGWEDVEAAPNMYQAQLAQESPLNQIAIGAGETVQSLLSGLGFSDEQQDADLAGSRTASSPWKTGGQIATDVAALTVPAVGLGRAGLGLKKALAYEAALAGAYEGGKQPTEGTSRGTNAALGAGLTMAGGAAVPALTGVARGVMGPMKEGARELIDQGVRLTPGQAYANPAVGVAEDAMGYVPGLAGGVRKRQAEALRDWNQKAVTDTAWNDDLYLAFGADDNTIGHINLLKRRMMDQDVPLDETFRRASGSFDSLYDRVWDEVTPDSTQFGPLLTGIRNLKNLDDVPQESQATAKRLLRQTFDTLSGFQQGKLPPTAIKDLDVALKSAIGNSTGESRRVFEGLRQNVHNVLPQDAVTKLRAVDSAYRKFATARRAGSYKEALKQEAFTPDQLLGAVKAKGSEGAVTEGMGPLQDVARQGVDIINGHTGDVGQKAASALTIPAYVAGAYLAPVPTAGIAAIRPALSQTMNARLTGAAVSPTNDIVRGAAAGVMANTENIKQRMERERQRIMAELMRR